MTEHLVGMFEPQQKLSLRNMPTSGAIPKLRNFLSTGKRHLLADISFFKPYILLTLKTPASVSYIF